MNVRRSSRSFRDTVDTVVRRAVEANPPAWESLVQALPGVYPTEVLETLKRLSASQILPNRSTEALICGASGSVGPEKRSGWDTYDLPIPHPLDFDWRFEPETAEKLLSLGGDHQEVICLGAPTLYLSAALQSRVRATLLDANHSMVTKLNQLIKPGNCLEVDLLLGAVPHLQAPVIFADPPWYVEHTKSFLWVARFLCSDSGMIFISLPPTGTRPGIRKERREIFAFARLCGLTVTELRENDLKYETPEFEASALTAAGVKNIPHWRRGTLCILKCTEKSRAPRPRPDPTIVKWSEVKLFDTRFRFRNIAELPLGDPRLISLVPGDILTSVSRRDPARKAADVWTSQNRIYACRAPGLLASIARALAGKGDPVAKVEEEFGLQFHPRQRMKIAQAAMQLVRTANLERQTWRSMSIMGAGT
jgi:hypothetical protein